jgi:allantoinase
MNKKGIYSKRCWLDDSLQEATIYIKDGTIIKTEKGISKSFDGIENVGNAILMPGILDAHVHVNEPGRTNWEGFETATQAAAAGGITTIVDMPLNASPVTTTAKAFEVKLASTHGKLHVNCGFYGGLIPGNENEIERLINCGVLGIKAFLTHSGIDEFPNVEEKELNEAMPILAQHNIPLLVHCELSDENHQQELIAYPNNYKSYLKSRPKKWENKAIAMMINLCRRHRCRTHIVHLSSAEALGMIAIAKEEGLPLTAETCPHYIYFAAEEIPDADTLFKCAPPIREKGNNEELKKGLKNGVLNFLATDHSPAPPELKEIKTGNLLKAWGGIAGLQFLLPASWTALKESMSLEQFIPLLTEYPAQFLNINHRKGFIKEGFDADLVVWQPEESFIVNEEAIFHKHKISPYVSRRLFGKVERTYVNGELVFENGFITNKNKGRPLIK